MTTEAEAAREFREALCRHLFGFAPPRPVDPGFAEALRRAEVRRAEREFAEAEARAARRQNQPAPPAAPSPDDPAALLARIEELERKLAEQRGGNGER